MSSGDLGAVVSGKEEESDGPEFGSEFELLVFEIAFELVFENCDRAISNR